MNASTWPTSPRRDPARRLGSIYILLERLANERRALRQQPQPEDAPSIEPGQAQP